MKKEGGALDSDYDKYFAAAAAAVVPTTSRTLHAIVVSTFERNGSVCFCCARVQEADVVLRPDGTTNVWMSSSSAEYKDLKPFVFVEFLDCVEKISHKDGSPYWTAQGVGRVDDTVIQMAQEHIVLPLTKGDKYGPIFFMHITHEHPHQMYRSDPGLRRTTKCTRTSFNGKMCVELLLDQTQWQEKEDLKAGLATTFSGYRMRIQEKHCRALNLTDDLATWEALMAENRIPLWVAACVNGEYPMSLNVLSVHWDLLGYLQQSCLELDLPTLKTLLNATETDTVTEIITNMSKTLEIPSSGCRYYAMTNDPQHVRSVADIRSGSHVVVYFAVKQSHNNNKKQKK